METNRKQTNKRQSRFVHFLVRSPYSRECEVIDTIGYHTYFLKENIKKYLPMVLAKSGSTLILVFIVPEGCRVSCYLTRYTFSFFLLHRIYYLLSSH